MGFNVKNFINEVKVTENEVCNFYSNSFTKNAEAYAKSHGLDGITCLIAEQKNDTSDREYVLIENDEYVCFSHNYEAMGEYVDTVALIRGKKKKRS